MSIYIHVNVLVAIYEHTDFDTVTIDVYNYAL